MMGNPPVRGRNTYTTKAYFAAGTAEITKIRGYVVSRTGGKGRQNPQGRSSPSKKREKRKRCGWGGGVGGVGGVGGGGVVGGGPPPATNSSSRKKPFGAQGVGSHDGKCGPQEPCNQPWRLTPPNGGLKKKQKIQKKEGGVRESRVCSPYK